MRNVVLLLTATINVRDVILIERRDPQLRVRDYTSALEKWLANPAVKEIVFCENSGSALDPFRQLVVPPGKTLELLSCDQEPYPKELGKGYGELTTITYALNHSRLLSSNPVVFKVTGRYYVSNASRMVEYLQRASVDIVCDLHRHLSFADTSVLAGTVDFLRRHLCPRQGMVNDSRGVYLEHVFAGAVYSALASGLTWRPLPCTPLLLGMSGTSGLPHRLSYLFRLKSQMLHFLTGRLLAR